MWALNVPTLKAMSDGLGIRESAVSDAKRRQTIPARWLVQLQLQWNIHPLWVLTGCVPPVTPGILSLHELERFMNLVR